LHKAPSGSDEFLSQAQRPRKFGGSSERIWGAYVHLMGCASNAQGR
jgi:hypothetical protein